MTATELDLTLVIDIGKSNARIFLLDAAGSVVERHSRSNASVASALGWELDAITMVILGGVAIEGGRGSIVGTLLAIVLIGVLTFGMGMANVTGIVMSMLIGITLIVAMVLPRLLQRRRATT